LLSTTDIPEELPVIGTGSLLQARYSNKTKIQISLIYGKNTSKT
jgi:hypothetical protein